MKNILICYYGKYPTRTTILDHLYSFERYSGERCFYLDLATQKLSGSLRRIPFDLIIFHTIFLSARWNAEMFRTIVKKVRPLKDSSAVKVVIPQDEFYCISVVCDFINEFGIEHVFSVSPPSEWQKIYKTVDFSKVKFHQVLTGYLDKHTLERIERTAKTVRERDLVIGYRAWKAEPWLGRHGFLKTQLAEVFQRETTVKGINADISTQAEDTMHGDNWYRFLYRCRYTIGVEGGASILDWDGSIRERTDGYLAQHPKSKFEEVELACFPGMEGSLSLFAISPRHLEACATKTCQILIEGEYNGVLVAGWHYIALKKDFSNLDEVFAQLGDEAHRNKIVENAYQEIVQSGKYFYEGFVRQVLEASLGAVEPEMDGSRFWLAWQGARFANLIAWGNAIVRGLILIPLYQKAIVTLPNPLVASIQAFVKRVVYK